MVNVSLLYCMCDVLLFSSNSMVVFT